MRRGRQNFELNLFGCKNVPYFGQINVRWWGKKYLGVQKAPGGAKKLQGTQKAYKKNLKNCGDLILSFFLGDSKKWYFVGALKISAGGAEW